MKIKYIAFFFLFSVSVFSSSHNEQHGRVVDSLDMLDFRMFAEESAIKPIYTTILFCDDIFCNSISQTESDVFNRKVEWNL